MSPRVMVTGMPSYLTNTISSAEGVRITHRETLPDWRRKKDFLATARSISNTGNFLIGEGALHSLPWETTTYLPFWHLQNNVESAELFRDINAGFDVCVFTAANLIRSDFSAEIEAKVLERIDLPLVVLGVGIQRRSDLDSPLPEGTLRLLNLLKERNAFVLTRGHETADFLQSYGIRNARAAGCPSMFHMSENIAQSWLNMRKFQPSKSSNFVFSGYLGAENEFESIRDMNHMTDTVAHYVLQDEVVSYGMGVAGDDDDAAYNSATGEVTAELLFPHRDMIRPRFRAYNFFNTDQWRGWISNADFALQRRFHGSVIAMQAGVPSIAIALDDRMREMLNYLGLPFIEREDWVVVNEKIDYLAEFIAGVDTTAVAERYLEREGAFREGVKDAGLI